MKRLYNFDCENCGVVELYTHYETEEKPCDVCGTTATKSEKPNASSFTVKGAGTYNDGIFKGKT